MANYGEGPPPDHTTPQVDSGLASRPSETQAPAFKAQAQALSRIALLVNGPADAEAIAGKVASEAGAAFSTGMVAIFLVDPAAAWRYSGGFGISPGFLRWVVENVESGPVARILAGNTSPVVRRDARADSTLSAAYDHLGQEAAVTIVFAPITGGGKRRGLLLICHNVERDYTDADLHVLSVFTNLLACAAGRVHTSSHKGSESDSGLRGRFFSVLSHELRTPLTSIMGFTQIIQRRLNSDPATDPRLLKQVDVVWAQAQRLSRLIDTLVDISHIELGNFTVEHRRVELVSIVDEAIKQALDQQQTESKIKRELPAHPVWMHGDRQRLGQMFGHLLSNALRYSPEDKPVEVKCEEQERERTVLVSILDLGPGIPANRLKELFEQFQPGEAVRSGGLGAGLIISKTIVEAHGGLIAIRSTPRHGTTVTVTLPV
jgi:signal transduction histidine kinase